MENTSSDIKNLLKQVEKTFGSKIYTTGDCNSLSEKIEKVSNAKISIQTLRRVFGLIKSPFQISNNTLNTLAKYIGEKNFTSFINTNKPNTDNKILLETVINLFYRGFWKEDRGGQKEESSHYYCSELILNNKVLCETFFKANYNYKEFVLPLIGYNPYYDNFKVKWYIQLIKKIIKYNTDAEVQCFCNGLLCLKHILNNNYNYKPEVLLLEKYHKILRRDLGFIAFVDARTMGSLYIYYKKAKNPKAKKILEEIISIVSEEIVFSKGHHLLIYYIFTILEYFNNANLFDDSKIVFEASILFKDKNNFNTDPRMTNLFYIIVAELYLENQEFEVSEVYYKKIKDIHISYYYRNYYTLKKKYLDFYFEKNKRKKKQLLKLIDNKTTDLSLPYFTQKTKLLYGH